MTSALLHLCSRATTFPGLAEKIVAHCAKVADWDSLLIEAEHQGLAPLLHWHFRGLEEIIPDRFRRGTRLLFLRHQHVNAIFIQVLAEVLELLEQAGIDVLVLKGAALCQSVYPEISLRPMRDIDLLVRREQAVQAQALLIETGFSASSAPRPADHFHLPSLHKKVGTLPVCIELHHGLFPDCPPYYLKQDFDGLQNRAISFPLFGIQAHTLGNEDMLWHVFHHGLRMPLTYEPFKLISIADIITLIEERLEEIDWARMQTASPEILAALPLLHYLTPWQEKVLTRFSQKKRPAPSEVGEPFRGWPHLRLKEQKEKSFFTLIRDTFLPPEWWCRLYYGVDSPWTYYKCRCLTHPLHVLWWMRLYISFLVPEQTTDKEMTISQRIRRFCHIATAIFHKFI